MKTHIQQITRFWKVFISLNGDGGGWIILPPFQEELRIG